ncbi:MAG: membrane protein insertase YidC [Verrucomicrobiota bacterium]
MDRKSLIGLITSIALLVGWIAFSSKLYPAAPVIPGATNAVQAQAASPTPSAVQQPPSLQAAERQFALPAAHEEQILEITNARTHYTFTSHGGGIKQIELLEYPEAIPTRRGMETPVNKVATLNAQAHSPAMALLGGTALQEDNFYTITRTTTGVRAEKHLTNGLLVIKDFSISTNYLIHVNLRLENLGTQPLVLPPQEWVVGTATPMSPRDDGNAVGSLWFNGEKTAETGKSYFSKQNFMCMPKIPPAEYRVVSTNVLWATAHNQFFSLATMPSVPAQGVVVRPIDLPLTVNAAGVTNPAAPMGFETALTYPGTTLAPRQSIEKQMFVFAGPKEYRRLVGIGDTFKNQVDLVMGFGGFFGFFAKALLLAMNWIHNTLSFSYGWSIVAITIFIKLLFWPLTQASTRSMKRMQALQPQMKAIQEKYKDDAVKMNRKTMEFMKEHKVSPLGGCIPMLFQIPVFFGFFTMIRSAIELRGASWLWVNDLSQADTLFTIPGTAFPVNLLPLIMGVTMLWQAQLTPPSPGMDPAQAKMMRYMPLMFMVFLYNYSSGLTLYWTVQNILTILQTKLTKNLPDPLLTPSPALTNSEKKRK